MKKMFSFKEGRIQKISKPNKTDSVEEYSIFNVMYRLFRHVIFQRYNLNWKLMKYTYDLFVENLFYGF